MIYVKNMKHGLSLCIQGTSDSIRSRKIGIRFIPVYTGNMERLLFMRELCTVYPCVYREHRTLQKSINDDVGLSLCIQGTSAPNLCKPGPVRFIPVYTGNIVADDNGGRMTAVYPCVYREHVWCEGSTSL